MPILFFSTLYAIGAPAGTSAGELALVVIIIRLNNSGVFFTYAFVFFKVAIARVFAQARRWFGFVRKPFRARRRANSDHAPDALTKSARSNTTEGYLSKIAYDMRLPFQL